MIKTSIPYKVVAPLYSVFTPNTVWGVGGHSILLLQKRNTANHLPLRISINAEWEKGNEVSKHPNAQRETFKYLWTKIKVCVPGEENMR